MSYRQTGSSNFPTKGFYINLQPALAWTAILGLVFFSALCILAGAGSILRLAFPIGSFVVGVLLYLRYPFLYIGFTLWMWFLTPLVTRLVDYRSGWDPLRLMLVSPFLVTMVTLVTLLRHLPKSRQQDYLPFILAFTGLFYGFLIGVINGGLLSATRSLLEWLTPVLFGFHLFVNWRDYPGYRQIIQRTLLWGVLLMGIYGVLQYLFAPEWDTLWHIKSGMSSIGQPEPLKIRVWSTMNSPGPFSIVMAAGLLLLFSSQEALRLPATVFGYLALLLSLVRTAWGAWFVGLIILTSSLKPRLQMRLMIILVVMAVCVFPLTTLDSFSEVINSRFQTFSDIESNGSYNDRVELYEDKLSLALFSVVGKGIGSRFVFLDNGTIERINLDSGILDLFFTLGWLGAICYLGGIFMLFFSLFQATEVRFDPFMAAARAISSSCLVILPLNPSMLDIKGVFLWGFLGLGIAAHKYYQHQRSAELSQSWQQNPPNS